MKKKILFVYDKMIIGGTTTSLLSLLNEISPAEYDIDLLLLYSGGDLEYMIPKHINVHYVSNRDKCKSKLLLLTKFVFSRYFWSFIKHFMQGKHNKKMLIWQFTNHIKGVSTKALSGNYDCAIGFMEGWSNAYVIKRDLKAEKRICWVHLDYKDSYLVPASYERIYKAATSVVLVSQKCLENFVECYPQLADKAVCIENILSKQVVCERSKEFVSEINNKKEHITFVTCCRIVFAHKGLDRAVNAFSKLKKEGFTNFEWHVIGDGQDFDRMKELIDESELNDHILILGKKNNPLPYVANADAFLLPSRYEGKPMAITEALMLGKPCFVCDYTSAKEQITEGVTGNIAQNDDEDIYNVLKNVLTNPTLIDEYSTKIKEMDFSNREEINKAYGLF